MRLGAKWDLRFFKLELDDAKWDLPYTYIVMFSNCEGIKYTTINFGHTRVNITAMLSLCILQSGFSTLEFDQDATKY